MLLRKIIFFLFIFTAFSYAIFTAKGVLFAPRLLVFSPKNWEHISGTHIKFSGQTTPKIQVWIDGALVESNEQGFFEEYLFFHPGYNEVGIRVRNRFGKEVKKIIKFVIE